MTSLSRRAFCLLASLFPLAGCGDLEPEDDWEPDPQGAPDRPHTQALASELLSEVKNLKEFDPMVILVAIQIIVAVVQLLLNECSKGPEDARGLAAEITKGSALGRVHALAIRRAAIRGAGRKGFQEAGGELFLDALVRRAKGDESGELAAQVCGEVGK